MVHVLVLQQSAWFVHVAGSLGYRAMADDDPRVPGHHTMVDEEEEQMPLFSQFSSFGGNLRRGMGFGRFLDLNSNVDDFPELGSYQQLLFDQSAGHGLPPIGPGRGRPVPQGGGGRSRCNRWYTDTSCGTSCHCCPA
ncbi:hypothetical protein D1007_21796 [Hordeum vulgare]|nr:hypothetical protein D1007_21796 [Hordeum vulgare]